MPETEITLVVPTLRDTAEVKALPLGMARICMIRARELEELAVANKSIAVKLRQIASDFRMAGDQIHAHQMALDANRDQHERMHATLSRMLRE